MARVYPDCSMNYWECCDTTPMANANNYYTKSQIDSKLEDLEDEIPDLSDFYTSDETDELLRLKTDNTDFNAHTANTDVHTTAEEKAAWNAKLGSTDLKTINGNSIVGSGNIVIEGGGSAITVDSSLSTASTNPVENRVITGALEGKADSNALTVHAADTGVHTTPQEKAVWNGKQNQLTAGSGISISNDVISVTGSSTPITVDSAISTASTNPVENRVIADALEGKADTATTYSKTEVDALIQGGGNHPAWSGTAAGALILNENVDNVATADNATAQGYKTSGFGLSCHAEGDHTIASGTSSHAEGSETQALGLSSHAEGYRTKAIGHSSHAQGHGTITNNAYEVAMGYYNESHSHLSDGSRQTVLSIGNGHDENQRSNMLEIMANGDVHILLNGTDTVIQTLLTDILSRLTALENA